MDIDALTRALILCGVAAPLAYAVTVVAGAAIRPGYSHRGNAISELIGAGAPNRGALNGAFLVYNLLVGAFGIGLVEAFADGAAAMRVAGWLVLATGLVGAAMAPYPMDPIGQPMTPRGRGHIVLAAVVSLATMAAVLVFAIGAGETAGWSGFAAYSYASFGWILVTGCVAALAAARLWPTMGLLERLTIGGWLQWVLVLAVYILA